MGEVEYKENESITYEITAIHKDISGAVSYRTLYRFWEVGQGDWKIHIVESGETEPFALLLPKKVIEKIINITVKNELKE